MILVLLFIRHLGFVKHHKKLQHVKYVLDILYMHLLVTKNNKNIQIVRKENTVITTSKAGAQAVLCCGLNKHPGVCGEHWANADQNIIQLFLMCSFSI